MTSNTFAGAALVMTCGIVLASAAPASAQMFPGAPMPGGYSYGPGNGYGAPDGTALCQQRYRSFDPATGTYLGYDGVQHPCPYLGAPSADQGYVFGYGAPPSYGYSSPQPYPYGRRNGANTRYRGDRQLSGHAGG
jgi:hypothetical protein